jgi:hypothetical protein
MNNIAVQPTSAPKIAKIYPYPDEFGILRYQVLRLEPKGFRQRRPDGNGGWINNLNGIRRILFHINELQEKNHTDFSEGEKDVYTLMDHGFTATCNPMGAGKWKPEYTQQLVEAGIESMNILPHNDEPGIKHATDVANLCLRAGIRVKLILLPGLPHKGDVSDWFDNDHTAEELKKIINDAPWLVATETLPLDKGHIDKPSQLLPPEFSLPDKEVPKEWEEPLPLHRMLPPPEDYPIDALGDVLGPAARKMVEIIQPPPALCAQSLLAAAALAVQPYADVEIDGRNFPLSEYHITIAESGERKTSTDRIALSPHQSHQYALQKKHREEMDEFMMEHDSWKKARSEALSNNKTKESKLDALKELGPVPPRPIDTILITKEPTYEGLVLAIMKGLPSMGLYSDEGGRLVGGHALNAENQLKTISGLSEFWDGSPITRTRAGDGNMVIYGRRLSLHLMIQPIVFNLLLENGYLEGQGLFSRCLSAFPESNIGNRPYNEEKLFDSREIKFYFKRMKEILEEPHPLKPPMENELDPRHLPLSPEAKLQWVKFHNEIEENCQKGRKYDSIRGFAAKAAEHAARLAGILTMVKNLGAFEISHEQMEAGIKLTRFYLSEALRLFGAASINLNLIRAEKALEWAKSQGGLFALVDLYQSKVHGIDDVTTARLITNILMEHRWIRKVDGGAEIKGKHRRDVFEVRSDDASKVSKLP